MISFRLRTTNETAKKLKRIHSATSITPNILARLSIALSLQLKEQPEEVMGESEGLEFNRHTLTGELDVLYKSLIKQHHGKNLSEKEYFPAIFNAHLTRGVNLLDEEYQYAGNTNKFIDNLLSMAQDYLEDNEDAIS